MESMQAGRGEESQNKIDIDIGQGEMVDGVGGFSCLGDVVGAGGGAGEASMAGVGCTWFRLEN